MRAFASHLCLICILLCSCLLALAQDGSNGDVPVHTYDPSRNAAGDVFAAGQEAQRTGRNVLVEVGGNWCMWCHILEGFFESHPEIAALRDKYYVTVYVNYSPENRNQDLLSRFPRIPGFPHIFVLDATGRLLHSQFTGALEQGDSYNVEKMRAFLLKWAPAQDGNQQSGSGNAVKANNSAQQSTATPTS